MVSIRSSSTEQNLCWKNKPRSAKDESISLAGFTNSRRVNDGCHLLDVLGQDTVVEPGVAVLQRHHVDILVQVVLVPSEVLQHALDLLLLAGNGRR